MNNKGKQYPNPRFSSLEEEDKYWETHSPLDEGFEGEVQTTEQKRSSFLSVRMTGDELSQLRAAAAKLGLGTSTYARLILAQASNNPNWPIQYQFGFSHAVNLTEQDEGGLMSSRGIYLVNTDDVIMSPAVTSSMLDMIRSVYKCRQITPNDADYEKVESLVKMQP